MTHAEIVKKLIGDIRPIGQSSVDQERFENLEKMCNLIRELIQEAEAVSPDRFSHEHSVKKAGEYAYKFLYEELGILPF